MVLAYVSLHTQKSEAQTQNEISYPGYRRMPIQFDENIGNPPFQVVFPKIGESQEGVFITSLCIGTLETGDGDLLATIPMLPHIEIKEGDEPKVAFINQDENGLPVSLNPIARVIWMLWKMGEIKAEDLHPALYEVVNHELKTLGLPVIPVVRSGAATMVMHSGFSLGDLAPKGNA